MCAVGYAVAFFAIGAKRIAAFGEASSPRSALGCRAKIRRTGFQSAAPLTCNQPMPRSKSVGGRADYTYFTFADAATRTAALADSLAGRLGILRLHPLAQCELARRPSDFLDRVFGSGFQINRCERLGDELGQRIVAGGYPAALTRPTGRRRTGWYTDSLETIIQRDVRDLSRIESLDAMPRLLALAAGQTARLLNVTDLAAPFQVSRPTIRSYITLIERVFLMEELPPWHRNRMSRLVKSPKVHMGDTGVASALLGIDAAALKSDRELLGQLLETFVFQELRRQASWNENPMTSFHYRDRDDFEVDIVIERGAGGVAGVEIKASSTVTASDFRGLRKLKTAAGKRFARGVVLYDGETSVPFGDGMFAVPIRMLWDRSKLS